MNEMKELRKEEWEKFINQKGFVLIDFWATWCGPCRMLTPVLEELQDTMDISIGKVDVDEEEELSEMYQISSIPTVLLFKDGKLVDTKIGYMPLENMKEWIALYE